MKVDPITTQLNIHENIVEFKVDTGCSDNVSLQTFVSKTEYAKLWTAGRTVHKGCRIAR